MPKFNNVRDHTNISDHLRKKVIPWYSNGPASLFCLIWLWSFGTTLAMSGCISSQASEGVCHCATICTRFSGKLNPLTPQFLIKITLGVISRKSWGWRSEGTREGQVSKGTVCIDDGGGGGWPWIGDLCCQMLLLPRLASLWLFCTVFWVTTRN